MLVAMICAQSRCEKGAVIPAGWTTALGLFLYDHLAGKSCLPKATRLSAQELMHRDPSLNPNALQGGFEFSDGQMNDHALGLWVAEQAMKTGVEILEHTDVETITTDGELATASGNDHKHDRIINIAGPWAQQLLKESMIETPFQLDLVRGSHLILDQSCRQAYLLESPSSHRVVFVLPWQGKTLVGTTEVRQGLDEPITCSEEEKSYLLNVWSHYFPNTSTRLVGTFSGLRPLLRSALDPSKASREYAIYRIDKLVTVFGGKWTTALALADKVNQAIC